MKLNKLSPNFKVENIQKTVAFYQENLGFKLIMAVPESQDDVHTSLDRNAEYVYASMSKDNVNFMFQRSDSFEQDIIFAQNSTDSTSVAFYMEISDIDSLYQFLKNNKLEITDIKTTWYGMKEFYLKDLNGYILGFAEGVKK